MRLWLVQITAVFAHDDPGDGQLIAPPVNPGMPVICVLQLPMGFAPTVLTA